ncbi:galactose oxidase-like domain-containing protein [Lysobacter niabensis]|uniref:galactose oxidase-like domain-containing protein n=1 Tax=Agrilutibacter niabensis TaxID=380628 RepID=UPI00361F775D
MALILAAVIAWAFVDMTGGIGPASTETVEGGRDLEKALAAASGDPLILAAIQTRANQNRVMRGDADALVAFQTAQPAGALTALPALGDPIKGTFSPVVDWPLIGIHAALTPDGRVLTYGTTTAGVRTAYYVYDVWDPQLGLGSESHTTLPNTTEVDIFCNAQLLLPDGNIEMWGGDVLNFSSGKSSLLPNDDSTVFPPLQNTLVKTGKMFRKRWYATATTLSNGEVYIQGGDGGGDFPEVRTSTGNFRLLTGASTTYLGTLYPRNFLAPDGKIFGTRYEEMYRVDPSGVGFLTRLGRYTPSNMGASSTAVMFRPGRILQTGGGYDTQFASPDAHVININQPTPVVQAVASPIQRRHWATSTMLPDGRVFLSGGSVADNDPVNGVAYTSELYDPVTNTWSEGATAQRMRLYHSTALLLPDATVLTLGGGVNGPELNLNAEIYYPGYLFKADGTPASRPIISTSPMTVNPGATIAIGTPEPARITRVTLLKTGSVTHSFNMDQRFLELPFTVAGNAVNASLPANAFETPPGFYMVFVFDDQGVPSEAAMLRINVPASASLTVNKVVVNNDGGNKTAADFSFAVNGGAPVAFEADGSNTLAVPAGAYSVTEPAVAGYAASFSNCSGLVLASGGSATCTITNNDTASPSLSTTAEASKSVYVAGETVTLTARVLNNGAPVTGAQVNFNALKPNLVNRVILNATTNSSGVATASFVSGTGPSSIGTYQLTVTATSGGLTAQAFATFDVLTNPTAQPATLTVTKVVVNNDGGSRIASEFTFSVNGATPVSFEPDGSNALSVPAGTYTITEPAVAGYAASFSNCSGIVLAAGGSATCTITNNDEAQSPPATLTVNKVVVNDDSGSKVASDFSFSVNGAAPVAFEANGSNTLSVPAGTYTVTEPAVAGYAASFDNCSGLVLASGESATCTITNNDQAPSPPASLTISKVVVNDNGGTRAASNFSFSVNGGAPVAFEADGSNTLSVPAGTYTITEPAVAGYAASFSNCSGLVLASGGNATCTITNNDTIAPAFSVTVETSKPVYKTSETVTLTARVFNSGAPVAGAQVNFNALKPNGVNRVILNATANSSGVATASFVSGSGQSSVGTYQLTVTATSGGLTAQAFATFDVLKNPPTQPATLTVTKVVVNNDGGSSVASSFSFSVNGGAPVAFEADGSNTLTVPAGTYTITEPAVAGYAASFANCSSVVLASGGSATCTITNNDQAPSPPATLTVSKVVVNDNGGTGVASNFSFSVNGGAPVAFEADGSNTLSVPAGTYTITEPAVAGYAASFANCSGMVLASGGSATCTITNNDTSAPAFSVTVETSKPVYIRGETVTLTARVSNNGAPVAGAAVNFNALKPNLVNRVILNAVTNSSGIATASFVSGTGPSSIGTYQLTVTATSSGLTAQTFTTFVVQ